MIMEVFKNMKKEGQTAMMIAIFVPLIIGVIVLGIVFSLISDQTTTVAVSNDLFTSVDKTCVRLNNNFCFIAGSLAVTNTTVDVTGNYSECGTSGDLFGAAFNTSGTSKSSAMKTASLNASYTRISCDRIQGALTTTIINNIPILFAVLLLVFIAGFLVIKR